MRNPRISGELLIRGGRIVKPSGIVEADVLCHDGRITGVIEPGHRIDADEVIEAKGLLVFPGFIDPHVHSRDPGALHKEDFSHSTRAAAASGITTMFEMPNTNPPVADVDTFRARADQHERVAHVDFGLWGLSLGRENYDQIEGLFQEGAVGIKLFWGYALDRATKELVYDMGNRGPSEVVPPPDNGAVFSLFKRVAEVGGLLAAHCEDAQVLRETQRLLGRECESYEDLLTIRPEVAEAAAIALGIEFTRVTRCRFHVVHVASKRGASLIRSARQEGIPVSAETCPHYLTLTSDDYADVGPAMKVYPLIRERMHQDALWEAISDGTIDSIGSDHAPHTREEKMADLGRAPAGAVGVETLVPLMLDRVARERMSPQKLAWLLSEGTARIFSIDARKGQIRPGADADLALVDLTITRSIEAGRLHTKQTNSPWIGRQVKGAVVLSVLRGKKVMQDGEPIGEPAGRVVRAVPRPVSDLA